MVTDPGHAYADKLRESVKAWVEETHPGCGDLGDRAGRLAARLALEGGPLGDVCRAAFAYVQHHIDGSTDPPS